MKINPGWMPLEKEVWRNSSLVHNPVQQKSFSDMLTHQEEKANEEQLRRFLKKIDEQGERLSKAMNVRELRAYKLLVKQFLENTVRRAIGIKDTRGWDRRGRGKRYKLLEELDSMLLEMAEELLEHEQGKIQLLGKIGEIRGMLINLLF
ncbi:YaaR family protein [Ferviditalea candida]|uniref:YaaR family protein n=1 Tax=Ferviditalea candida TaxID=3108399 RepID=A0ABU5ZIV9_9BACL|nr:YaaR family protein [Paenibacillaceae bacterium T2]